MLRTDSCRRSFGQRFAEAYATGIAHREGIDNIDVVRFPALATRTMRSRARNVVDATLYRFGLARRGALRGSQSTLGSVFERFSGLEQLDAMLADDRSRDILIELLVYRVLGPRHVRLSRNTAEHRRIVEDLKARGVAVEPSPFMSPISGQPLSIINLEPLGRSMRFHGGLSGVQTQFVLQQYRLDRDGTRLVVEPGDTVIDGGGCYGDTALHFADDAGSTGRVFTFEFIPTNLEVLQANLALNPSLRERIDIVEHPLWDSVGQEIRFVIAGPGSRAAGAVDTRPSVTVKTETIDHVQEARGIARVDFIKLDIEGAELRALKGAERTIRRDRPKLAVCLYHSIDDFVQIPAWLRSLDLGYKFYIDHFTIHAEETVLFAVPPGRSAPVK